MLKNKNLSYQFYVRPLALYNKVFVGRFSKDRIVLIPEYSVAFTRRYECPLYQNIVLLLQEDRMSLITEYSVDFTRRYECPLYQNIVLILPDDMNGPNTRI